MIDQSVRQLSLCTQHLMQLTKTIQRHCISFGEKGEKINGIKLIRYSEDCTELMNLSAKTLVSSIFVVIVVLKRKYKSSDLCITDFTFKWYFFRLVAMD